MNHWKYADFIACKFQKFENFLNAKNPEAILLKTKCVECPRQIIINHLNL